jgi:hypothetical protein
MSILTSDLFNEQKVEKFHGNVVVIVKLSIKNSRRKRLD